MSITYDEVLKTFVTDEVCTRQDLDAVKTAVLGRAAIVEWNDIINYTGNVAVSATDLDFDVYRLVFNAAGGIVFTVTGAADKTFKVYDTTALRGFTGTSSNAYVKFDSRGSAGGRWVLKSNTNRQCGFYEAVPARWKKEFYGGTLDSMHVVRASALFAADQYTDVEDVEMLNCTTGLYLDSTGEALRAYNNIHYNGCATAIQSPSTLTLDILDKLKAASLKLTYAATGSNELRIMATNNGGHSPLWFSARFNDADYSPAPTWVADTGIATLVDEGNSVLGAVVNVATHGTGDVVRYRGYMRAGAAPDVFGVGTDYYLGEFSGPRVVIDRTAAGGVLVSGTTYYVIFRAVTELSAEDSNVVCLDCEVSGPGVTDLSFSEMMAYLLTGERCYRAAWVGEIERIGVTTKYADCDGTLHDCNPTILQKEVAGGVSSWLPSQQDIFANDWAVVVV